MKITRMHYDFWCQHRIQVSWYPTSRMIRNKVDPKISVHKLIPMSHSFDKDFVVQNLIAFTKKYVKKDNMAQYLYERSIEPETIMSPEKVSAFCRKWLCKILEQRIKQNKVSQEAISNYQVALIVLRRQQKHGLRK